MILVLGSLNVDLVIRGPRLPAAGQTVLGGKFFQTQGGKGANQAVAAARAGAPLWFIGAVGADAFGQSARSALEQEGINCQFLVTLAASPTGVALIMVSEQGENCISVASGANALVTPVHVHSVPPHVWQQCRVLVASLEVPWETIRAALSRARQFGLKTIVNPAPVSSALLEDPDWSQIDLMTPNEHEAAALSGITIESAEDAVQAARCFQERGCSAVIITRGAQGATLVTAGRALHVPAAKVIPVDTTAAGDAFNGALAAHWARHGDLIAATHFATAAAGLSVTREGAQPSLPRLQEIDAWQAGR